MKIPSTGFTFTWTIEQSFLSMYVFRTLPKVYDGDFLQKQLTAKSP